MVATRMFSGDVVAEGDDLSTTATVALAVSDPQYDPNGVYVVSYFGDADDDGAVSHVFVPGTEATLTFLTVQPSTGSTYAAPTATVLLSVGTAGISLTAGAGNPSSNHWLLARIT